MRARRALHPWNSATRNISALWQLAKGSNRGLPPLVHQRDQASLEEAVEAARRGLMTSRVAAWVIPTNEEVMIARHTLAIAAEGRAGAT